MTDEQRLIEFRAFLLSEYPQAADELHLEICRRTGFPRGSDQPLVDYQLNAFWDALAMSDENKGSRLGLVQTIGDTAAECIDKARERWGVPFAQAARRLEIQRRIEAEDAMSPINEGTRG